MARTPEADHKYDVSPKGRARRRRKYYNGERDRQSIKRADARIARYTRELAELREGRAA